MRRCNLFWSLKKVVVYFVFHTATHQIMEPENRKQKIESTEKSEDTVNYGGNKFIAVLKNITIEPAIFLLMLSGGLDDPLIPQFIITKICSYDFGYNETVCDDKNLVTVYPEENDEIQKEVCCMYVLTSILKYQ